MCVIPEYNQKCQFCISPYFIKTGSGHIVESSILSSMKHLYTDGILTMEPVDVRLISEAEAAERLVKDPDSPIDSVVIYFRDKK